MWNCCAALTRNGSLYNNTVSLTLKNNFLQRYVAFTFKRRLLRTNVITNEEFKCAEKLGKCSLNGILQVPCNQAFRNARIIQLTLKELSVRQFHTSSTAKRAVNNNDILKPDSVDTSQRVANVNLDKIFTLEKSLSDKVSFSHIPRDLKSLHDSEPQYRHSKLHKLSLKDVEKKYPTPKQTLNNIYALVKNVKKVEGLNFKTEKVDRNVWECTVNVFWPEEQSFIGKSHNKIGASYIASLKCLHWLETLGKLDKGKPILYNSDEIKNLINTPVPISIRTETLNAVRMILDKYEDNIQLIIQSHDNTLNFEPPRYAEGAIIDPVGTSNPAAREESYIKKRNDLLKLRYESRMKEREYVDLPITEFREMIVEEVEKNNVLVIKGDTGCGKTTQVPQYIMDSFIARDKATDCNMIVSEPRRISAISLSERIANERREQVGDVVGYQVRLSQELPNTPAGMLFCTTGILLRKLQFNPTLEGCSHVIVDEAHERTINTDMLLVLLKRAIQKRPSLKVIIMSATINAELFQQYFSCKVIEIPGRIYPVEMNFMEDIDQLGLRVPSRFDLTFANPEKESTEPSTDIVKMGELISFISRHQPPGAILCFLPGWSEIVKMKKYLEDYCFLPKNKTLIVPIHSKMSHYDQRKIFYKPAPGVRKIVLATDIAETGITVADVVYVVDSCIHRQMRWNEKRGFASIENHWIAQANLNQRKGRAGRVKPGVSYHFISKEKFAKMLPYPTPEVMRSSLDKTVLDAKTYSSERAADFLGLMPQPPSPIAIRYAVDHLINLGALDHNENLTPLGKRIALFTVNPELSKAIVYSSIFQCLSPMITMASIMSEENEIFSGVLYQKESIRNVKNVFHPTSDHISLAWLFQQWYSIQKESNTEARQFAIQSQLVHEKMFTLSKVREINTEHLYHAKMLPNTNILDNMSAKENEYAELDELCRGVLLAGLDHVIHRRNFDFKKGQVKEGVDTFIMEDGNRATITPDSVNFKRKFWPSPYLTYVRRTHSEERRTSLIRETSIVSPLTVFLFSQARINGYVKNKTSDEENNEKEQILFNMSGRKNVNLICDKSTADVLLNFRDTMWAVVRYLVANQGMDTIKSSEFDQVEGFKLEMLQVLGKMLSEASEIIDDPPKPGKKNKQNQGTEKIGTNESTVKL